MHHPIEPNNTIGATPSLHQARCAYREARREARSQWRAARHEARQARREFRHGPSSSCHSHSHCGARRHMDNNPCCGSSSASRIADVERTGGSGAPWEPATPGHPRAPSAGALLVGAVAKALGIGKGKMQQNQQNGFVEERVLGYGDVETDRHYRNGYKNDKRAVNSEHADEVTGVAPVRSGAVGVGGVESTTRSGRRVQEDEGEISDEPLPTYEAVVKGIV